MLPVALPVRGTGSGCYASAMFSLALLRLSAALPIAAVLCRRASMLSVRTNACATLSALSYACAVPGGSDHSFARAVQSMAEAVDIFAGARLC